MVSLEEAVIARLSKGGERFEILVDPKVAIKIKEEGDVGEDIDLMEALAIDKVFRDARKGDVASEDVLSRVFGTLDVLEISKTIILQGEIKLTSEQIREMRERKKKQIISFIHRNAVDPKTGAPHPPSRIEKALDEAGVHIDPFKGVEDQANEVIKKIRAILPLKIERVILAIKVPPEYSGKAYGVLRGFGRIKQEEWDKDGSWLCLMEIPAGVQEELYEKINEVTKGEAQTKLIERI